MKHTRNDPSLLLPVLAITKRHSIANHPPKVTYKGLEFDVVVDVRSIECLDKIGTVEFDHGNVEA